MANNNIEGFANSMAAIIRHCTLMPDKPLRWTIIANPTAGGFTIRKRRALHDKHLEESIRKNSTKPLRKDAAPSQSSLNQSGINGLIPTTGAKHAQRITESLIKEIDGTAFHLIITSGGDGTSLEVLSTLYHAPAGVRSSCVVLRLPMGTGNDGADAWELNHALDLLIEPAVIDLARAVRLSTSTPGKGPFYAFNVLSVGLDAFVTHNTNKMKGNLPGDSYKLWVDLASLFYDRIYKVGPMEIEAFDEAGKNVQSLKQNTLLMAMGPTGHRTYGSHNWVLPDDRNVCVIRQMSVFRKIVMKEQISIGTHIDKPESTVFNAHRIEFKGKYPILAQMDGETVLINPEDYPAVMELTEPVIPILQDSSGRDWRRR
ncbi:hypothetical protein FACS1894172_14940 [Spirochaetia bacterium]|nr:hypothetical protein FACS1894164_14650 [Spirochaetia bacterium]GHU34536.1 hypothetical protein FACS1894172_14940 [Spirochaetia bacterium]